MNTQHPSPDDQHEPEQYEIRLKGHLDARWADQFEHLRFTYASDGTTILTGPVVDQAALYGVLRKVRDLGLLLFGIAIFRARILSRWAAVLLACSGPLAILMVALLPHQLARLAAMPMGFALIWLGYALWSERRAPASERVPGRASPQLS